jgi:6-phospho-3-hexuloisomerase
MQHEMMSNDQMDSEVERVLRELGDCLRQVSAESLTCAGALIESSSRIFVAGAGRSGLCMRAFGMRLMHLGKTLYVVGETTTPGIAATDLLVLGSGSGRTTSLCAMAEQARRLGAQVLLFTTDAESPLARLSNLQVVIPAPSFRVIDEMHDSISVQPLGTLFEQSMLILCDSLILGLMRRTGVSAVQMFAHHANLE